MEINYELKPEDYWEYAKAAGKGKSTFNGDVTVFIIMYLMFMFADLIFAFATASLNSLNVKALIISIVSRVFIIFGIIGVLLAGFHLIKKRLIKKTNQMSKNGMFCQHKVVLTENELIEITDINVSRYSWTGIENISEIENFVSINILLSQALVIPKRDFGSSNEVRKFIDTANLYKSNSQINYNPSYLAAYDN